MYPRSACFRKKTNRRHVQGLFSKLGGASTCLLRFLGFLPLIAPIAAPIHDGLADSPADDVPGPVPLLRLCPPPLGVMLLLLLLFVLLPLAGS